MMVKPLIVTLIIIISKIQSPLAPSISWHGCTLTITVAAGVSIRVLLFIISFKHCS